MTFTLSGFLSYLFFRWTNSMHIAHSRRMFIYVSMAILPLYRHNIPCAHTLSLFLSPEIP